MTSATLEQRGFGGWQLFSRSNEQRLVSSLPSVPAVYCIRCARAFTLTKGASDILYIGSTANRDGLRARVYQYLHPGQEEWTNKRLLARCGDSNDYQLGFISCESGAMARQLESELLEMFLAEHGQPPPENRQPGRAVASRTATTGSTAQRMFDAVAGAPMSPRTRRHLQGMAALGDSLGLLRYLERCVKGQREVGRSIRRAGQISFEDQMPLVRKIYEEK